MNYSEEFKKLKVEYRILVSPSGEKFRPQIKKQTKIRYCLFRLIYTMFYKHPKKNEEEFFESLKYCWVDLTGITYIVGENAEEAIKRHIKNRLDSSYTNWSEKFL